MYSEMFSVTLDCCCNVSRFETDPYDKVPFFMFGDFNFRLDTNQLVKVRSLRCIVVCRLT